MVEWITISGNLNIIDWGMLVAASFLTSMITAVFGIGGGITLLAVMAQLLPAAAVIPVHGVVQAGSNIGRASLLLRHIQWPFMGSFAVGAALGSGLGGSIVITLPTAILQAVLGCFILFAVWGPQIPAWASGRAGIALQGAISSVLTFFVGATGPFIAAVLKPQKLLALEYVATFAAAMSLQHMLKIAVFIAVGFQYGPYFSLMIAMLITGLLGTLLGTKLLKTRANADFQRWLNIILTVLGFRLLMLAANAAF